MADVIKNRYEFVILFDVENGNPNGDPDAGNLPRIDPESGYGIVTDVCIKRKIRNYVETVKEDSEGYKIYIKEEVPLNRSDSTAYDYLGTDDKGIKDLKKKDLEVKANISHYTVNKLNHGDNVTTEVIEKICLALDCTPDDIMEIIPDKLTEIKNQ